MIVFDPLPEPERIWSRLGQKPDRTETAYVFSTSLPHGRVLHHSSSLTIRLPNSKTRRYDAVRKTETLVRNAL